MNDTTAGALAITFRAYPADAGMRYEGRKDETTVPGWCRKKNATRIGQSS
jgi:hypothetical protein